jgi:hypothetical protein
MWQPGFTGLSDLIFVRHWVTNLPNKNQFRCQGNALRVSRIRESICSVSYTGFFLGPVRKRTHLTTLRWMTGIDFGKRFIIRFCCNNSITHTYMMQTRRIWQYSGGQYEIFNLHFLIIRVYYLRVWSYRSVCFLVCRCPSASYYMSLNLIGLQNTHR